MDAWRVEANGPPESALSRQPVAVPGPGRGQALVDVRAAGLNFSDLLMIRGSYQIRPPLPFTPGQEVAGVVRQTGPDCPLAVGERVVSKVLWGGFAPLAIVESGMAIRIPEGLSDQDALVLPVIAVTAWIALHERAHLQQGDTLLVHAGAGALGLATIRIAAAAGARVLATVGSPDKADVCRAAGADTVIDYREATWDEAVLDATAGAGVDVVMDSVGGTVTDRSIRCLAPAGRLLIAGFSSGEIPSIRANRLLLRNISAIGVYWSHGRDDALVSRALAALLDGWQRGQRVLRSDSVYPFERLPDALADLAGRRTVGKCALARQHH